MPTPTELLRDATNVLVVTGAGISAPSGLATYRSVGSRWDDPHLERVSHASRYGNHLDELWAHWTDLRTQIDAAIPNAAHHALASYEKQIVERGGGLLVATQNVDGLHQQAGSDRIVELHGTLKTTRCMRKSCNHRWPAHHDPPGETPSCPQCGKSGRPDVVLFGERLASRIISQTAAAAKGADVCVYVGTSGQVSPVADLVDDTRAAGGTTILVNEQRWGDDVFDHQLIGDATRLLPPLLGVAENPPAAAVPEHHEQGS